MSAARLAGTYAARLSAAGFVAAVERVGTSRSGNPTHRVRLSDGRAFLTEPDSQIGHTVTNYVPRASCAPRPVTLTLNARGRVTAIQYADRKES